MLGGDFGVSIAALRIAGDASVARAATTRTELGLRLAARLEMPSMLPPAFAPCGRLLDKAVAALDARELEVMAVDRQNAAG